MIKNTFFQLYFSPSVEKQYSLRFPFKLQEFAGT